MSLALFGFDELEAKLYYLNTGKHISENLISPPRDGNESSSSSIIMDDESANQGDTKMEEDIEDDSKEATDNSAPVRMTEDISDDDNLGTESEVEDMEVGQENKTEVPEQEAKKKVRFAEPPAAENKMAAEDKESCGESLDGKSKNCAKNAETMPADQDGDCAESMKRETSPNCEAREQKPTSTESSIDTDKSSKDTTDLVPTPPKNDEQDAVVQNKSIDQDVKMDTEEQADVATESTKQAKKMDADQVAALDSETSKEVSKGEPEQITHVENKCSKEDSSTDETNKDVSVENNLHCSQAKDSSSIKENDDNRLHNGIDHLNNNTDAHNGLDLDDSNLVESPQSVSPVLSSGQNELSCKQCYVKLYKIEPPVHTTSPEELLKSCKNCYVRLNKLHLNDLLLSCRQCSVVVPKLSKQQVHY